MKEADDMCAAMVFSTIWKIVRAASSIYCGFASNLMQHVTMMLTSDAKHVAALNDCGHALVLSLKQTLLVLQSSLGGSVLL